MSWLVFIQLVGLEDLARNKKNIVHHMTALVQIGCLYGGCAWQASQGHVELYLYMYDTVYITRHRNMSISPTYMTTPFF